MADETAPRHDGANRDDEQSTRFPIWDDRHPSCDKRKPFYTRQTQWIKPTVKFESSYGNISGRHWVLAECKRYNAINPAFEAVMDSDAAGDVCIRMWHFPTAWELRPERNY